MSEYKPNFNRFASLSAIRGTDSAMKTVLSNNNFMQSHPNFYSNIREFGLYNTSSNRMSNLMESGHNVNYLNSYRKNLCLTEMRDNFLNNNNNTNKTLFNNFNTSFRKNDDDFEFPMSVSKTKGTDLAKENEDLRRDIYELKKTYYDVVQSKEQQIKLLNQNHNLTLENCEKLIKEAEWNYLNLKTNYEEALNNIKIKEQEIETLKQKTINQDTTIQYYKDELQKFNDFNFLSDTNSEEKFKLLQQDKVNLEQQKNDEINLLQNQINNYKSNVNNLQTQLKEKSQLYNELQIQLKNSKKNHEKDLQKLKVEIKNYKNLSLTSKLKNNNANINNTAVNNKKMKEYEDKINKLETENKNYKASLNKIENTQIKEYQKLLEESFAKIQELNNQLQCSKDKNKYLEKALNIVEKTARKYDKSDYEDNDLNINENSSQKNLFKNKKKSSSSKVKKTISNGNYLEKSVSNTNKNKTKTNNSTSNSQLLSKKRLLPKIYQTIADKQISGKTKTAPTVENDKAISEFQL